MTDFPEIRWPEFGAAVKAKLNEARKRGASLRKCASYFGISLRALSHAESGKIVGAANYLAICDRLDLNPYDYVSNVVSRETL